MPSSPIRRADFALWGQAHAENFVSVGPAVGLSVTEVQRFADAFARLQVAAVARDRAREAARAATAALKEAYAEAKLVTGATLRRVRLFAEDTNNPQVYQLARIAAPASPAPAPPPGTPTGFALKLENTGAVTISFRCKNPPGTTGTSYIVRRKLPGQRGFSIVGATGKKRFTDTTLPAGVASAEYTVQGLRSGSLGAVSLVAKVRLGSASETPPSAAGGEPGGNVKLAA